MCLQPRSNRLYHTAQVCSRLYYEYLCLCKYTFAQRRNCLTTHFSERIPVVKGRIFVVAVTGSPLGRQTDRCHVRGSFSISSSTSKVYHEVALEKILFRSLRTFPVNTKLPSVHIGLCIIRRAGAVDFCGYAVPHINGFTPPQE